MRDYQEHQHVESTGFHVIDATSGTYPIHDDLVWVSYGEVEGRWLTVDEALNLARAINDVASRNAQRRETAIVGS